jgi:hypothetical protein
LRGYEREIVVGEEIGGEQFGREDEMKQTSRWDLLLSYYQAMVFGSAPKQDIELVVSLVEGLKTLNPVPQFELLTLRGLGGGTMNSLEVSAAVLFRGVK